MKYLLASISCIALAAGADAQTTTVCNRIGQTVYCTSSLQRPGPSTQDWLNAIPHPAPPIFSSSDFNAMMERHRQTERDSLRRTVGQMVAAGQCPDARATALNAGDFDLAREVDSMCQPGR